MLENFANLIASFFDLVEAEGRTFREKSVLVIEGFLVMFFGVTLGICGAFAVGAAFYIWLCGYIGKPLSALLVAVFFLGTGTWLFSKGRTIIRSKGGLDVGSDEKSIDS